MPKNGDFLVEALEDLGYTDQIRTTYSGRGVYGKHCVGIELDSVQQLWDLSRDLAVKGEEVPAPRTDNLGLGIIAYWPGLEASEPEEEEEEAWDPEDQDQGDLDSERGA